MNTRFTSLAVALVAMLALSACVTNGNNGGNNIFSKENIGMVLGGAGGGYLGSQIGGGKGKTIATVLGVLMGGYVGKQVGVSLDRADQLAAAQNAQSTLNNVRSGTTTTWRSSDYRKSVSGTFTPTRTYQRPSGQYCREYQQTITIGGKTENGYGTACRQPDGSWQITNNINTSSYQRQTPVYQPRYTSRY